MRPCCFLGEGVQSDYIKRLNCKMGIQRPSLYSAFGDKEELFEAALRKYTTQHAAHIRTKLQNNLSVKEAFHTLFAELVEEEYGHGPSKGCFCINTIVELAPHEEKFEILTREHQMYLSVILKKNCTRYSLG